LQRVVGQLPPVLPHCPRLVSFFPEEGGGDGRQCPPSPDQPRATTEKRQAGNPRAPCACGVPYSSFPIPEGKASAPLRRTSRVLQKRVVFCDLFGWGNGMAEWVASLRPPVMEREEREGGEHPMRLGERASINDDDDDCAVRAGGWNYCVGWERRVSVFACLWGFLARFHRAPAFITPSSSA
jgi:hypothetical protein